MEQLRAEQDGARLARRRLPRRADRDQRGPRLPRRHRRSRHHGRAAQAHPRGAARDRPRRPRLRRRRHHPRADPHQAGQPLHDGRGQDRHRGPHRHPRPLRRRRGRLRLGPRRQPPRRQLAARHADLRPPLRRATPPSAPRAAAPSTISRGVLDDEEARIDGDHRPRARGSAGASPRSRPSSARRWTATSRSSATRRASSRRSRSSGASRRRRRPPTSTTSGTVFNQDVLGAIELGYMLDCAEATVRRRRSGAQGEPRRAVPHRLPGAQRRGVAEAHRRLPQRTTGPKISYSDGHDHRSGNRRRGPTRWCRVHAQGPPLPAGGAPSPSERGPYWETFDVELDPTLSVLDGLLQAKDTQDGSIAVRCSCRAAICGSCGVKINGQSTLACKTQLGEAAEEAAATRTARTSRSRSIVSSRWATCR